MERSRGDCRGCLVFGVSRYFTYRHTKEKAVHDD